MKRGLERFDFARRTYWKNESIIDAVIREMKEETGLDIQNPRLCGIRQLPIENGRYIVFFFMQTNFSEK